MARLTHEFVAETGDAPDRQRTAVAQATTIFVVDTAATIADRIGGALDPRFLLPAERLVAPGLCRGPGGVVVVLFVGIGAARRRR